MKAVEPKYNNYNGKMSNVICSYGNIHQQNLCCNDNIAICYFKNYNNEFIISKSNVLSHYKL